MSLKLELRLWLLQVNSLSVVACKVTATEIIKLLSEKFPDIEDWVLDKLRNKFFDTDNADYFLYLWEWKYSLVFFEQFYSDEAIRVLKLSNKKIINNISILRKLFDTYIHYFWDIQYPKVYENKFFSNWIYYHIEDFVLSNYNIDILYEFQKRLILLERLKLNWQRDVIQYQRYLEGVNMNVDYHYYNIFDEISELHNIVNQPDKFFFQDTKALGYIEELLWILSHIPLWYSEIKTFCSSSHNDLTMDNILISKEWTITLIDWPNKIFPWDILQDIFQLQSLAYALASNRQMNNVSKLEVETGNHYLKIKQMATEVAKLVIEEFNDDPYKEKVDSELFWTCYRILENIKIYFYCCHEFIKIEDSNIQSDKLLHIYYFNALQWANLQIEFDYELIPSLKYDIMNT